ncbi:hypothetical protein [Falsiroseomonas tokyonensis]|uniref:Uncharacterized protein n=1 Tax=Falsiroseomonas tokyonensis TaxID=430521 RepID=A0ABV7C453_9PROT|nr:hypothetical protein [Falsiroseomonas tokyonensis]MBU8541875.1 hypothetical protein [Falsiroseomonas tokyonensis]
MRDVLGGFNDEACLGDVSRACPALRLGPDELASRFEALGDELVERLAVEHALAAGVVGGIEAAEQLLELDVRPDGDVLIATES